MKSLPRLFLSAATGMLAFSLAGCAAPPAQKQAHEQHHSRSSAPQAMERESGHAMMGAMEKDMAEMCDMHTQMMSAKSPQERRAMMQEHMKSMSPEDMQKHMDMMQKKMTMMQSDMQMMREHMSQRMSDK